ncbi:MAG TPA: TA system VapC family ribonuclease toxin [Thermoanaerobaculia bacterium]|nr:TA system VapC family ribonuclease toxin [Thermoanaerobaculia bacterium]
MLLVDTNVLVYATLRSCPEHEPCRAALAALRAGAAPWFLTWPILYELLRVLTHPRALAEPLAPAAAWEVVERLLDSPSLQLLAPTPRHAALLAATLREVPLLRGSILHDVHTAVLLREHGVRRILTRDTGFHRFPFLEVVDPLAAG